MQGYLLSADLFLKSFSSENCFSVHFGFVFILWMIQIYTEILPVKYYYFFGSPPPPLLRGEGADVYLFYNKKITTLHQIVGNFRTQIFCTSYESTDMDKNSMLTQMIL